MPIGVADLPAAIGDKAAGDTIETAKYPKYPKNRHCYAICRLLQSNSMADLRRDSKD